MNYNSLTPEEERVIVHKGTELSFTGKYYNFFGEGVYVCKRCNTPLFQSSSKFDAGCGWPSFDDAIPNAVNQSPDADGHRIEITCATCGAHLGHVFKGEGFTPKNTRHCVNSISLNFVPASQPRSSPPAQGNPAYEKAIFAGGCFWGVEYHLQKAAGVISTRVGYIGGHTDNPSYRDVCSHQTGHAEAVEVTFDPTKTTYETLARLFFEIHDPSQLNHQGPDVGDQYRSAIFYLNDQQKAVAEKLIQELKLKGYTVVTTVEKAPTFWTAEEYHQNYYTRKKSEPYCHIYTKRF